MRLQPSRGHSPVNLKLAIRRLFKTPFVSIIAILSLALGIGANAAIFSLFDQTLLRALPVQRPNELVNLSSPGPRQGSNSCGQAGDCESVFSYPMFRDLEKQQTVVHRHRGARRVRREPVLSGADEKRRRPARVRFVLSGARPPAGARPAAGPQRRSEHRRPFRHGPEPCLLDDAARRQSGVLNQTLIVNGQRMTIVGVAPRGFNSTTLGMEPEVFVPITMRELMVPGWKGFDNRRTYWVVPVRAAEAGRARSNRRAPR